jgi:hypothetical protein
MRAIMEQIPPELKAWLDERDAFYTSAVARAPDAEEHPFVLATLPLKSLNFQDGQYNPREPIPAKIKQLAASISSLTMLTPLTAAHVDISKSGGTEPVVLLDGRHRFKALEMIVKRQKELGETSRWSVDDRIDVKIYHSLSRSQLNALSVFLNEGRRSLKKGEYYSGLLTMYNNRAKEMSAKLHRMPNETEVFETLRNKKGITNLNLDLSIGLHVARAGFDGEAKGWFPFVGKGQGSPIKGNVEESFKTNEQDFNEGVWGDEKKRFEQKFDDTKVSLEGSCPITAGNLAYFLKPLCRPSAFPGEKSYDFRSTELQVVRRLGEEFQKCGILTGIENRGVTPALLACKHWTIRSFSNLLAGLPELMAIKGDEESILANAEREHEQLIKKGINAYAKACFAAAPKVNQFRDGLTANGDLDDTSLWAVQTQPRFILPGLAEALKEYSGLEFEVRYE